ncbi:bifunctional transcriptional activator/DNA repair enzyme AdaA [Kutzneria albida]|uniref:bifunctional transcriptional activator/DNA repair enzyme AdaA n=1 Tax=Kutzneria albida TaxID=43357 RepID=UPI00046D7845|nr:AlkA N-terminal domain-containing protein [Kutzneria albida]
MTTYSAVRTTGIYCRPGCGAKPLAENVRTFELAAAAETAGYRACLRCRPYRVAGAVADNAPELVCRAVQLIINGLLDESTEAAVGHRLGISARHLRRMFHDHLGVTPDGFARSRRAHFARRLLDDSDLPIAEVAFAAGFGSLRQFNRAMREVFRSAPSELRARRRRGDRLTADGGLLLRMPFTAPYDWDAVLGLLAARAVPGVESVEAGTYRRTITLDGAPGMVEIGAGGADHLLLRAHLPYWEGVIHVVERAGRLVGVDQDTAAAAAHLAGDPLLGPLIAARPGLRVPGAWDPFEIAVNAVTGDVGRLVRRHGAPVDGLGHGLTHAFPAAEVLAEEHGTVGALARAVLANEVRLDGGEALDDLVASLRAVPGVTETAAHEVALRLGARDAFPVPGVDAAAWRPYRALAATHLFHRNKSFSSPYAMAAPSES